MLKLIIRYQGLFVIICISIVNQSAYSQMRNLYPLKYCKKNEIYFDYSSLNEKNNTLLSLFNINLFRAKKITKIIIEHFDGNLPFSAEEFPNLKELMIVNYCGESSSNFNLKGISSFSKLEVLSIRNQRQCNEEFLNNRSNISEIWNCKGLKKLVIDFPIYIDNSISKLKKLEVLCVNTYSLTPSILINNKNLAKLYIYNPYMDYIYKVEYLTDIFFLLNQKYKRLNSNDYKSFYDNSLGVQPLSTYKPLPFDNTYFKSNFDFKNYNQPNNGNFNLKYINGNSAVNGWYKDNLPDSIWVYFFKNGDTSSIRKYNKGKLVFLKINCENSYFEIDSTYQLISEYDVFYFSFDEIVDKSYFRIKNKDKIEIIKQKF